MADYMIKGETLTNIANAIRAKSGSSATITPIQMSTEIENISVGGGDIDALIDGSLTEITSNVTSVKHYAFTNCTALTSITLPLAKTINSYAFSNCTALTSITLPLVDYLYAYAFTNCTALTSITLPLVEKVFAYAFSNITALTSITLPLLTSIQTKGFHKCMNLKKLIIGINITSKVAVLSNTDAFVDNFSGFIYVPNTLVADYRTATNWSTFASQIFPWVATVEELANIDTATYTRACVGTENNGTEYTYNGTSWEVVA